MDRTARVWDAATGQELALLRGHEGGVTSASFSPSGDRIVTASHDNTARVWDSVPYRERFPAIQRARAAEAKMGPIVAARLAAGEKPDALRAAYAVDTTLTAEERTAALAIVHAAAENAWQAAARQRLTAEIQRHVAAVFAKVREANDLSTAAWNAIRFAPVATDVAVKALADARKAVELRPDNAAILNTLGVALYRAGQFEEALSVLARTDALYVQSGQGQQPADWAFIAMARWKLGQQAEARAALATFRTLAESDRWKTNEEVLAWTRELDAMIPATP
jgi:tetratricopeptide (TPR) repeat protein